MKSLIGAVQIEPYSWGCANLQHCIPQVCLHYDGAVHEGVRQVCPLKIGAQQHRLHKIGGLQVGEDRKEGEGWGVACTGIVVGQEWKGLSAGACYKLWVSGQAGLASLLTCSWLLLKLQSRQSAEVKLDRCRF
jgi:hypothetical protein